MNTINLSNYKMCELTQQDALVINGGHDGDAYNAGKTVGKAIDNALKVIGAWLLFL